MFELEFYKLPDGTKPVAEFIKSLNVKMRAKAIDSISILEKYGPELREPYSKSLGDGIFELRIKFVSDIVRLFYFFFVGEKIVLTNGFIKKKTGETPSGEQEKAKKYKEDYERRQQHD